MHPILKNVPKASHYLGMEGVDTNYLDYLKKTEVSPASGTSGFPEVLLVYLGILYLSFQFWHLRIRRGKKNMSKNYWKIIIWPRKQIFCTFTKESCFCYYYLQRFWNQGLKTNLTLLNSTVLYCKCQINLSVEDKWY